MGDCRVQGLGFRISGFGSCWVSFPYSGLDHFYLVVAAISYLIPLIKALLFGVQGSEGVRVAIRVRGFGNK